MTNQPDEPTSGREQPTAPENRAAAVQKEIDEAELLPDPTLWESYGRQQPKSEND